MPPGMPEAGFCVSVSQMIGNGWPALFGRLSMVWNLGWRLMSPSSGYNKQTILLV